MTIRRRVQIMPGGTIELHDPSLPVGEEADVVVSIGLPEPESPESFLEREFDPTVRPFWEDLLEIAAQVPDEEWEKVPTDLARNLDHYLYGAPKEEE